MKVTHSVRHDMAYIALKEIGPGEAKSQLSVREHDLRGELSFVLDTDCDGRLLGIEIFDATLRLPPEVLEAAERIDTD